MAHVGLGGEKRTWVPGREHETTGLARALTVESAVESHRFHLSGVLLVRSSFTGT